MISNSVGFEKAWLDVYYMLGDNALDSARCMYMDDGSLWADGVKYEEVPF